MCSWAVEDEIGAVGHEVVHHCLADLARLAPRGRADLVRTYDRPAPGGLCLVDAGEEPVAVRSRLVVAVGDPIDGEIGRHHDHADRAGVEVILNPVVADGTHSIRHAVGEVADEPVGAPVVFMVAADQLDRRREVRLRPVAPCRGRLDLRVGDVTEEEEELCVLSRHGREDVAPEIVVSADVAGGGEHHGVGRRRRDGIEALGT